MSRWERNDSGNGIIYTYIHVCIRNHVILNTGYALSNTLCIIVFDLSCPVHEHKQPHTGCVVLHMHSRYMSVHKGSGLGTAPKCVCSKIFKIRFCSVGGPEAFCADHSWYPYHDRAETAAIYVDENEY